MCSYTTDLDDVMEIECQSCLFRSGVRLELNNLSKSIAGLLSCRLCDVVLDLRKLRASQDQKVEYACLHSHLKF